MSRKRQDPVASGAETPATPETPETAVHEEQTPDLSIVAPATHGGTYVGDRRIEPDEPEPPAEPSEVTNV